MTASTRLTFLFLGALALTLSPAAGDEHAGKKAKLMEALRAAPAGIAVHATVKDWDGTVLREGTNGWSCYPAPEMMPNSPMCIDAVWEKQVLAWVGKRPFKTDKIGLAYMLMGDGGSSNVDPYATGPTADNEWVVEGAAPHDHRSRRKDAGRPSRRPRHRRTVCDVGRAHPTLTSWSRFARHHGTESAFASAPGAIPGTESGLAPNEAPK